MAVIFPLPQHFVKLASLFVFKPSGRTQMSPVHLISVMSALILSTVVFAANPADKLDAETLFLPDQVVEIRLEVKEIDWQILCNQSRNFGTAFGGGPLESPYTYFPADLWINDVKIANVGVRKKGFLGSNDNQRPSLKIKFDEYEKQDPVRGLDRLTLNNNKQDRSLTSQFLVYRLYRDAGLPAPRSGFARVTVNGQELGIYSNVESLRKPFLKGAFGSSKGNLYEGTIADFHPRALERIQVKTNKKDHDSADLRKLAELLDSEEPLNVGQLNELIDVDEFIKFWALEGLTGFWDGYAANQNNYWVYFNPKDDNRGHFIPWGTDWNLTNGGPFNRSADGIAPVIYAQAILANRLYHAEGIPERYQAALKEILAGAWNESQMLKEIDRLEGMLLPYLNGVQGGAPDAMNEVRQFIRERRGVVERQLKNWNPDIPESPRSPSYTVEVGRLTARFESRFSEAPTSGQDNSEVSNDDGNFQLQLDDQNVLLTGVTVAVTEFQMPRFGFGGRGRGGFGRPRGGFGGLGGGFGGRPPGPPGDQVETPNDRTDNSEEDPPPQRTGGFRPQPGGPPPGFGGPPPGPPQIQIAVSGKNPAGEQVRITINVDQEQFQARPEQGITVAGGSFSVVSDSQPQGGFRMPFGGFGGPRRSVTGTLFLTKSGTQADAPVAGSLNLQITESRGGMFGARRGGGGGFGGPPRGGFGAPTERQPRERQRPELEE